MPMPLTPPPRRRAAWIAAALLGGLAPALAAAPATLCTALRAPGGAVSFVYGTVHMDDARLYTLPPGADAAFDSARVVLLEAELDPAAMAGAARFVYYQDGTTLQATVGDALYQEAVATSRAHGLPEGVLEHMKPWAVASALSTPLPQGRPVLDQVLQMRALEQGKRVVGLETVEEQLAIFDAMPPAVQKDMLEEAVRHYESFAELRGRLVEAFLARDLDAVSDLAQESLAAGSSALRKVFERDIIDARNARMVERAKPMLVEGGAFMAVGAMHLPGPDGVLARLERAGFTLAPGC